MTVVPVLGGEGTERKTRVQVYWKGECIASCMLEFRCYSAVIDGVNNILLEVCQTFLSLMYDVYYNCVLSNVYFSKYSQWNGDLIDVK